MNTIVSYDTLNMIEMRALVKSEYEIEDVINKCKTKEINLADGENRKANMQFMFDHDLMPCDICNFVRNYLRKEHLYKGPVNDDKNPKRGAIWIFHVLAFDTWCYVKIQIKDRGNLVHVISFHEQELGGKNEKSILH